MSIFSQNSTLFGRLTLIYAFFMYTAFFSDASQLHKWSSDCSSECSGCVLPYYHMPGLLAHYQLVGV
jgi:hypothetical protein